MKKNILFALILLITIFIVQNSEPVSINIFIWELVSVSKIYLISGCIFVGFIIGLFISGPKIAKKQKAKKPENSLPLP